MRAGEPSGSTPFHVRQELIKPALVLCGVSGCGKSTLGSMLSERLRCTFLEGDDFHPPANIATMSAGVPLTDEDRWPWLESLASCARRHLSRCDSIRKSG
ncbi:CHK1 [Auxenochlorella protothecoides x Auxenochlorella symbiontica]